MKYLHNLASHEGMQAWQIDVRHPFADASVLLAISLASLANLNPSLHAAEPV